MNSIARTVQLGSLIGGDHSNLDHTKSGVLSYGILNTPKSSYAISSVTRHVLYVWGEMTGTTAIGFGDDKATYGAMFSFGRTVAATAAFVGTDTSLDVRCINKLANNAAYQMQAAYIKAKNYTGGVVGNLTGLYIEAVNDGTATSAIGLKIGSDSSTLNFAIDLSAAKTVGGDIKLYSGATISSGSAAPTHSAAQGSIYLRTGQTVNATLYINTDGATTWTLCSALA